MSGGHMRTYTGGQKHRDMRKGGSWYGGKKIRIKRGGEVVAGKGVDQNPERR